MALIDEDRGTSTHGPKLTFRPIGEVKVSPQFGSIIKEPDWRDEEIRQLRRELCQSAPSSDDPYWLENTTWVGCVGVWRDTTQETGDFVKIAIKATTKDDTDDIWKYYEKYKFEIDAAIRSKIPAGNIRIVDLKAQKGSITLFLVIQITIGLAGLLVAVLGNYDRIKQNYQKAMPQIKQFVKDAVSSFKSFFRGFGFGGA